VLVWGGALDVQDRILAGTERVEYPDHEAKGVKCPASGHTYESFTGEEEKIALFKKVLDDRVLSARLDRIVAALGALMKKEKP
jgi:hypothetical protein